MKVLVLGADGMLGHKMLEVLRDAGHNVAGTSRDRGGERLRLDAADAGALEVIMRTLNPDVVVNCIGVVQKSAPDFWANAEFPHRVAAACEKVNAQLIHISTDCVFSGSVGMYTETITPHPIDDYGRSKLAGEVGAPHLTIRTSIVGRSANGRGLLEWFLEQPGPVRGYTRAIFSGLTTLELSRRVESIIAWPPALVGVLHVSADPISKYDLLGLFAKAYGLDTEIVPDDGLVIDRSLNSDRFRRATGWQPPSWEQMVTEMAADEPLG